MGEKKLPKGGAIGVWEPTRPQTVKKGFKNEACTGITRTEVSGMYKIQNCLLGTYRLLKNILETTEEILWV